jgi:uncharacterized damage-inducible protein DinB
MDNSIAQTFLDVSCNKLEMMTDNLHSCVTRLSNAEIWERHGAHENAVGNLILHLSGNARQWVIHGVGGVADVRTRDKEFSADSGLSGAELMGIFAMTMTEARGVIASTPASRLTEIIHPQGRTVTVLEAIYQVVAHVHQHVGQIILLTKQMTRTDLDLTTPRPR